MEIVVATRNLHKLQEIRQILAGLPVTLIAAADLGAPDVVEDQDSLQGNARKKAHEVAAATGKIALADDTGLHVDALDGEPGVHSARFAGPDATYEDNVKKLLSLLEGVPQGEPRAAYFECVMWLAGPRAPDEGGGIRDLAAFTGELEGFIAEAPRGSGGFGYDPVFLVRDDPKGRTLAELSADEKNAISHRGAALRGLREGMKAAVAKQQQQQQQQQP